MEVKLPRLKVDRDDEGFLLGKLSLSLIIGFGIHWTWVYITMFVSRDILLTHAILPDESAALLYMSSLVVLVISLYAYAVFSRAFRKLFGTQRRRFFIRAVGALLSCAGTVILQYADAATDAGIALLYASGIMTGIGSAILLMSYGVSFGQCDTATIVTSTALALIVGVLGYALIYNIALLFPFGWALVAAIPLAECYCLYLCSNILVDKLEFAKVTLKVRKAPFALRICAPSLLLGFTIGSIRLTAITDMHRLDSIGDQVVCIILAGVFVALLMLIAMFLYKQHLNFLFRPLIPLIVFVMLWGFFDDGGNLFISTFVMLCGYMMFEGIMWVSYGEISQRYRLTAFIVFGFGRGSLALGALLAYLITGPIGMDAFGIDAQSAAIIGLSCLAVGFTILPRANEVRSLVINESENPADEEKEANRIENNGGESGNLGRFKRKCGLIANRYLLSKKETEVLFLLAKGRNAAYIQEQLYISEGTARTHMRHIYKKLDIHTQQELIDIVDSADTE